MKPDEPHRLRRHQDEIWISIAEKKTAFNDAISSREVPFPLRKMG